MLAWERSRWCVYPLGRPHGRTSGQPPESAEELKFEAASTTVAAGTPPHPILFRHTASPDAASPPSPLPVLTVARCPPRPLPPPLPHHGHPPVHPCLPGRRRCRRRCRRHDRCRTCGRARAGRFPARRQAARRRALPTDRLCERVRQPPQQLLQRRRRCRRQPRRLRAVRHVLFRAGRGRRRARGHGCVGRGRGRPARLSGAAGGWGGGMQPTPPPTPTPELTSTPAPAPTASATPNGARSAS
ncbi:hypothetical protein BU14_0335s0017 [Porphyra umbilicalis]|uniref:Uncharacterized protein n=1 Tax=Porphyra umbilicalis TaxID=2786 RepID=A0A1X6NYH7_PORUM|nr:hypothetical protein BU14_0335s0017 [Porphyra umbilicalis]|eukprot:OSX73595.1 hypothetical protein BU14_0335s0017 [Porphyra umbilicalis]